MDAPIRYKVVGYDCGMEPARDGAYISFAEHERVVVERDRLREALSAVKEDCLERAAFSRDGQTVPIGDGAWRELCAALSGIKEAE